MRVPHLGIRHEVRIDTLFLLLLPSELHFVTIYPTPSPTVTSAGYDKSHQKNKQAHSNIKKNQLH